MKQFILPILLFLAFTGTVSSVHDVKSPKSLKVVLFDLPKYQIKTKEVQDKTLAKEIITPKEVLKTAKKYLGVKYKWGGNSKKGIDCSGFTKVVYKKHDVNLARTSGQQFKQGKKITKTQSKKGDLIFFSDSKRSIGHVGIIIDPEKNLMIHASSGAKKVTISNYNKPYYRKHYKGIRRIS